MSQRRLFRDEAFARRGRAEPIDGLLRITAPHEWVFLALLAVALIAVLAWAVFGTIERGLSASCLVAAPAGGGVEAVARLPNEDARRIVVGMAARVQAFGADGSLNGAVTEITRDSASANSASSASSANDRGQSLVVVGLADSPSAAVSDGDACDLRIVTSREAPISLIAAVPPAALSGQE